MAEIALFIIIVHVDRYRAVTYCLSLVHTILIRSVEPKRHSHDSQPNPERTTKLSTKQIL